MTTGWSEILNSALTVINDIRWREQLAANPAEFYRAKSAYIMMAVPLLCRPPALLQHLQSSIVTPTYASTQFTVTEAEVTGESVTVQTGFVGFELMSVVRFLPNNAGVVPYTEASYDAQTGAVRFPAQYESGVEYSIDFYTDGQFQDLTLTQKRLLALAVAIVWDEHFERDWLNKTPKIHDSSFESVNEANYTAQGTKAKSQNRAIFEDELRKYEQNCAYTAAVPKGTASTVLI